MTVQPFSQSLMVLAAVMGLGGAIALPVQAEPQPQAPIQVAQAETPGTIVDVASGNEAFETLVAAVQAAGLVETLSGEGPFTVFAPTDEAFAELPDGVVDALLKPENRDLLTEILTYHVVPGEVMSSDLETGPVETLNGGLAVRVDPDKVVVNNGSVIMPDVPASNGVIHAINRVLIPAGVADELASRMQPEPIRGLW
ncbi:fasciclin domain-containing protein [Spirulina major]|uniref:fasciclin domain-containing protein n=1 Tax=Spirulina major TaxID=270636 RepID=UPI00093535D7|nr:fasciclin domain-containing protein [Spirulina major]